MGSATRRSLVVTTLSGGEGRHGGAGLGVAVPAEAGGWYRGDCHVHSERSYGGELTPAQLAAGARAIGLDFLATTEHNTSDTHGAWGPLAGDDLLVILGQEVTTRTGHWLALGIDPGQVVEWRTSADESAFVRIEVRHPGGHMAALTNPVILMP